MRGSLRAPPPPAAGQHSSRPISAVEGQTTDPLAARRGLISGRGRVWGGGGKRRDAPAHAEKGLVLDRKWGCFEEINAGLIRLSFTVVVSGERGGSLSVRLVPYQVYIQGKYPPGMGM